VGVGERKGIRERSMEGGEIGKERDGKRQ